MKKRHLLVIAISAGIACTGGVVLAARGTEPGGATADPVVKLVRGSEQPSTSQTSQDSAPAAAAATSTSTQASGQGTTQEQAPVATAVSDTPGTSTVNQQVETPATPTLVSSRYYCTEQRPDGTLYEVAPFTRPASTDVEVQLRLDTYSDGSTQLVNLGPDNGICAVMVEHH